MRISLPLRNAACTRAHTDRQRLPEEEPSLHSRVVGHLKYYFDTVWIACGRLGGKTLGLPFLLLFKVLRLQNQKRDTCCLNSKGQTAAARRRVHYEFRCQRDSPVVSSPQQGRSAGPSPPLASAAPAPPFSCGPSPGRHAGTPGRPRPAAALTPASGSSPRWTKQCNGLLSLL